VIRLALLRGINVGGKNRVDMAALRATFAGVGIDGARTYINTGNVIFRDERTEDTLARIIEAAIEDDFGFAVSVLVRDMEAILAIEQAIPDTWANDSSMKCDVLLLWDDVDRPDIVADLPARADVDELVYVPGAVIWRVDRDDATKSGMPRLVGTDVYKRMTVRNCNTVRRLAQMMRGFGD
jgi:uncharacterized protein (DUF1697 family)